MLLQVEIAGPLSQIEVDFVDITFGKLHCSLAEQSFVEGQLLNLR